MSPFGSGKRRPAGAFEGRQSQPAAKIKGFGDLCGHIAMLQRGTLDAAGDSGIIAPS